MGKLYVKETHQGGLGRGTQQALQCERLTENTSKPHTILAAAAIKQHAKADLATCKLQL